MSRVRWMAPRPVVWLAAWLVLPGCGVSLAEAAEPVLRDPAVPAALRQTRPAEATHGAALQAQVDAKLQARFAAADTAGEGHISRAQAEAAGLGFVARHFEQIDTAGHGSVSWAQVQAWLAQRQRSR